MIALSRLLSTRMVRRLDIMKAIGINCATWLLRQGVYLCFWGPCDSITLPFDMMGRHQERFAQLGRFGSYGAYHL